MAGTGSELYLLNYLKSLYPTIPYPIVTKVMTKFENDQGKCLQALDMEKANYPDADGGSIVTSSNSQNVSNSADDTDVKQVAIGMKELQVAHVTTPSSKPTPCERHVSTIERSIGGVSRPVDPRKPISGPSSVSWTVSSNQSGGMSKNNINTNTPKTAPADFTQFIFQNRSQTEIPNITCKTHGPSQGQHPHAPHASHQFSFNSGNPNALSASNSPIEQRRPVKVISIPPGALSGGSVSPAATPPSSRHFRMNFGDTGGVCAVTNPHHGSMQRHASSPNVNQNYRSEIHAEALVPQPGHSLSILVDTKGHGNHYPPERKISGDNTEGRRTPNPLSYAISSAGDFQPSPGATVLASTGQPLSIPVQVSSPGASQPRPMFLNDNTDAIMPSGYKDIYPPSHFYNTNNIQGPPLSSATNQNFGAHAYNHPLSTTFVQQDFNGPMSLSSQQPPPQQPDQGYIHPSHQIHTSYANPPTSLYNHSSGVGYSQQYPAEFANILGFPIIPQNHINQYLNHNVSRQPQAGNINVSRQRILGSRSNSQDSEHSLGAGSPEYDPRMNHFPGPIGPNISSQVSGVAEASQGLVEVTKSRSGSMQEEKEYLRALLQHQKSRFEKLFEDTEKQTNILETLRGDVLQLEDKRMNNNRNPIKMSFPCQEDIAKICESNRRLQTDIQVYMNEIETYKSGQTPLNKIDPIGQQNFYENLPTGQQTPISNSIIPDDDNSASQSPTPPPRPPPPIPSRQRSHDHLSQNALFQHVPPVPQNQPTVNSGDSEEGDQWSCSTCTFKNHPALKKCEMCEMPRVVPPAPPLIHQPTHVLPPRLVPSVVGSIQPRSSDRAGP